MTPPTRLSAERTPEIGESIGQYRLVGVLADAGPGRLYVAERQGIRGASRTVSLLRVHPELARDPQFRTQFEIATRLAPRIQHPNVASIYEMGEVEGSHFVSMEYLPGESLAAILRKCYAGAHMSPDMAATLVKHTANAARHIHDLRVAEGLSAGPLDLEPSSVFVTYHGTLKLLGVGLRAAQPEHGSQRSGMREAAARQPDAPAPAALAGSFDVRADVFHLGVMLWTCLTGRPPHRAYGSGEADAVAPSQQMVPASSVRAEVPEALDVIATRAMSPDARERYPSAAALSEALEHFLVRRDTRPTHMHVRRWMERQLFDPERASLQRQIAEGYDVEVALSLLATPRGTSGTSSVSQRRTSLRPRELWSVSQSAVTRLSRRSPGPPPLFDAGSSEALDAPLDSEAAPRSLGSPSRGAAASADAAPRPGTLPPATSPQWGVAPSAPSSPSAQPSPAPPAGPRWWMLGVMAVVGAIIAVAALVRSSAELASPLQGPAQRSSPSESGQLEVRSVPDGAAVFVDGEPTGLRTPAALKGLESGRTLRLRVEKAGFASQERQVSIQAGPAVALSFDLLASDGRVRFEGVPAGARIYIDDVLVAGGADEPVPLPAGRHAVRVEAQGALIFSDTVVIVAGEQTLPVDGAGARP